MEAKWMVILMIGLTSSMFISLGMVEYRRMECRIEGVKSNLTPEAVDKICK